MTALFQSTAASQVAQQSERPLKISELAEKFGISLRTLRFYEEKGLLKPGRKDGWARLYREDDIARLDFILNCRSIGLSVDETRHLLEIKDKDTDEVFQKEAVEAIRERISALEVEMDNLNEQKRVAHVWLERFSIR